jgi:hypothetical protein
MATTRARNQRIAVAALCLFLGLGLTGCESTLPVPASYRIVDGQVQITICTAIQARRVGVAVRGGSVPKWHKLWTSEGTADIQSGDVFDETSPPRGMTTDVGSHVTFEEGMLLEIHVSGVSEADGFVLGSFPVTKAALSGDGWTFWSGKHDDDACNVKQGVSG